MEQMGAAVQILVKKVSVFTGLLTAIFFIYGLTVPSHVFALCNTFGSGGTGGASQTNGTSGQCNNTGGGSGGAGGGGSAAGGAGGNGAGGTVVFKNTTGSMTLSGTVDARGGSSSTTNGGSVKLFYTGSAPSTSGVTSGRTYTAAATTQLSDICIPSTITNDSSVGTVDWSSPADAAQQDGIYSWNGPNNFTGMTTHYIVFTGCQFSVPTGATITGIQAGLYRSYYNGAGAPTDTNVRIVKGGSIQSTNHSAVSWNATTYRWDTYGNSTDMWGATLTPSDINLSTFGIALSSNIPGSAVRQDNSEGDIDATHITVYYTLGSNSAPAAPTLIAPSSGATGQASTPTFQLRTTDADNDYLKYKIIIYNSDCSTGAQTFDQTSSQTGWSGQDQQSNTAYTGSSTLSSSTIANFNGVTLSNSTQYCWKAAAIDPGGNNVYGSFSSTQLFTTAANSTPSAPTLVSPGSGATGVSTGPLLQLRSSDADNDYLRYKILLYNSDCSTGLQTFDQTSSQTGWSGQDLQGGTAYTGNATIGNSTIATYGAASLSANTQYCWKAAAIDPAGTNTFSSFSGTQLFTTGSATGQVQLNGGVQINGGTLIR